MRSWLSTWLSSLMIAIAMAAAPAVAAPLTIGSPLEHTFTAESPTFSFHFDVAPANGTDYLYFISAEPEFYSVDVTASPGGALFYLLTPPAGLAFGPGSYDVLVTWLTLVDPIMTFDLFDNVQPDLGPLLNVTETPLPATLPLMGSLVLAGWLAARRRRGGRQGA